MWKKNNIYFRSIFAIDRKHLWEKKTGYDISYRPNREMTLRYTYMYTEKKKIIVIIMINYN